MDPANPQPPVSNDPPAPAADEPPAWAQSLIDGQNDINNRLTAFEENIAAPPAPEPPQHEEPPLPPEWKPNSWEDVDARARELARAEAQALQDEREAAAKKEADEREAITTEVDQFLDSQIDELTKVNKLPSITNENDPNDPGKLAQRELYGYALSLGTADLKTAYTSLEALHGAGKQFNFVKMELVDKNPASLGANSPVGSSSAGPSGTPQKIDYKTIHGNSLDALAHRFMQ